jgi:hypothetical protein
MVEQYKSKFWKTHEPVAVSIDYITQNFDLANQPIFILDENPKLCASYLTVHHLQQYIEYIIYSIINFRATQTIKNKVDIEKKPRVDYMFYNQRTAFWFYTLYQEMQEIYKKRFGKYYKVTEYFNEKWLFDLTRVTGPMNVKNKAHKGARLLDFPCLWNSFKDLLEPYENTLKKIRNRIGKFRVMYMLMGYLYSEFPLGAPAWYNNMKATIWNSYNKMTRLYYRIDTNIEGVYSYYYSIDNKNWTEIKNIPTELRGLIDGIIFAREV